jgi:hypothetical protein
MEYHPDFFDKPHKKNIEHDMLSQLHEESFENEIIKIKYNRFINNLLDQ